MQLAFFNCLHLALLWSKDTKHLAPLAASALLHGCVRSDQAQTADGKLACPFWLQR